MMEQAKGGVNTFASKTVMDRPELMEWSKSDKETIDAIKEIFRITKPEYDPKFPEYPDVCYQIGTSVSEAVAGMRTPKEAMDIAQAKALDIMTKAGYY